MKSCSQLAWRSSAPRAICLALSILFASLIPFTSAVGLDDDSRPFYGHIYLEGGRATRGLEYFGSDFGGPIPCEPVRLVLPSENEAEGCHIFQETPREQLEGAFIIVHRGTCSFQDKAEVIQLSGGAGMVVINNSPGLFLMPKGEMGNERRG